MKGSELYSLVNILAGTDSHHGFSTGNCLPLIAYPWGHTHWTIQTTEARWFFHPDHQKFQGFRATHQPSPWMGDYGQLVFMPFTGEPPRLDPEGRSSAYWRGLSPHRADITLNRYGINCAFEVNRASASLHWTAAFEFPKFKIPPTASDTTHNFLIEGYTEFRLDARTVCVKSTQNSGGIPDSFGTYYVFEFDCDVQANEVAEGRLVISLAAQKAMFRFSVKIGVSFISYDQAKQNILNDKEDTAEKAWHKIFKRFRLKGQETHLKTFAHCLYRACLFPRETHEYDADGNPHHYSFYTGEVLPGEATTDNGFWDTYRTVYPWYNLFFPSRSSKAIQGWIKAYEEGGWFPQWATPGYRACMVGTHIDAVIADAVVKGTEGFDKEKALEGMLKHAYQKGDDQGAYGRLGIEDYLARGYVSEETVEGSVARSLDYAYDDWCIAQVQYALGQDSVELEARGQTYRHLFDPEVGFMRAKHANGEWANFREFEWGGPYVEGGPWQASWAVQHDPEGLAELFGGEKPFLEKLKKMFETPPYFEVGHYRFEIHEMTEMAQDNFGQYAHSNQPVHHVIYFFMQATEPEMRRYGRHLLKRVMNEMYTPNRFCGDEDNGEMACWFLFSSLGFFPFCPGKPEYIAGAMLFDEASITMENGSFLNLKRNELIDAPKAIAALAEPGIQIQEFPNQTIPHTALKKGGIWEMPG